MTRWEKFLKWLGFHVHDRKLFCVNQIAFVKCIDPTCGMESIPWEVSADKARDWHESHPDAMKELLAIKEKQDDIARHKCG